MTTTLLDAAHSLNEGSANMMDISVGGQNGFKRDADNYAQQTIYAQSKLIPVLITAPGAFRYMPDGEHRTAMLRALIEVLPKSITGLSSSLETTVQETPVNASGEVMQTITKVTRTRSEPVHLYDELKNKPITAFFKEWLQELFQDEETGHPAIISKTMYIDAGSPALTVDMKTATVLYYEPNEERTDIVSAYLVANWGPQGVEDTAQRVIDGENEVKEVEITATALTVCNTKAVKAMAKLHLESLNRQGANVDALGLMATEIAADVAANTNGYVTGQEALANAL